MISMIGIINLFFFGSFAVISLQIEEFVAFAIFATGLFLSLLLEAKIDILISLVKKVENEKEND